MFPAAAWLPAISPSWRDPHFGRSPESRGSSSGFWRDHDRLLQPQPATDCDNTTASIQMQEFVARNVRSELAMPSRGASSRSASYLSGLVDRHRSKGSLQGGFAVRKVWHWLLVNKGSNWSDVNWDIGRKIWTTRLSQIGEIFNYWPPSMSFQPANRDRPTDSWHDMMALAMEAFYLERIGQPSVKMCFSLSIAFSEIENTSSRVSVARFVRTKRSLSAPIAIDMDQNKYKPPLSRDRGWMDGMMNERPLKMDQVRTKIETARLRRTTRDP